MIKLTYILKSFLFFKKQHLAVIVGTIISTAVLTGALIVGDSVKYSLSKIVEKRLGNIQYVLQSNDRFVRDELAKEISIKLNVNSAPVILLQGASVNPLNEARINKTQVIGVDSDFWFISEKKMPELKDDEAIISTNVAEKLHVNVNDEFVLRVEKISVIPLNFPFSSEDLPSVSFRLKIKAIADDNNLGRFSLMNNQVAPFNVFISRENLSTKLDLNGLTNLILIAEKNKKNVSSELYKNVISDVWQSKDAGIEINKLDNKGNYEVTSDRIFIDKQISSSVLKKISSAKTILTYLVNSITLKQKATPYSFVSAVSSNYYGKEIKNNEIIINEWLSEDINAKVGDTLDLKYFVIDSRQNLKEDSSCFIVKAIIPTKDSLINRSLMPKFPGFAKAISCMEWNTNIPIDLKKIRDKDEKYWNEYRGTPKAVISIDAGLKLWQNNFGDYTSIRFNDTTFKNNRITSVPESEILKTINPKDLNLTIVDVKNTGIQSAKTGVDFGELFLSLSFFVILAGVILTGMLYVLNLDGRKTETGILLSIGFTRKQVIRIRIFENIITITIGSVTGVTFGILFNYGLLAAINSVWNDIVRTSMMDVSIQPLTLFIGACSGFLISIITIYISTIRNFKKAAIGLINNSSQALKTFKYRNKRINSFLLLFGFVGSFALLIYSVISSVDQNAELFLTSGGLFMLGSIAFTSKLLNRKKNKADFVLDFKNLAMINTSRNKSRSLTIVILLSLGVFVVIITGANRRTYIGTDKDNSSGTGGYTLWVETSVPLAYDFNSTYGKEKLGIANDSALYNVQFSQMSSLNGDDASCLNLNHVENPRILGVNPDEFNKRKSFSFDNLAENVNQNNPWLELKKIYGENVIPAYVDQTVITWGLLKKIGDTLTYVNESGKKLFLVIVGGLSQSIFQGNILISEEYFNKNFPSISGSKLMLIDVPVNKSEAVSKLLINGFQDYGIEISATTERLSQFNSVTNTYLSVFMILGGLGIIIGTFGIGIILYRNMLDRKQETAMLMALGFTKQKIFSLIFKENLLLISIGIIVGVISSLIGIIPSLMSVSFKIPNLFVFIIVILIFTNALIWIYMPIKKALKSNIITSLRNE